MSLHAARVRGIVRVWEMGDHGRSSFGWLLTGPGRSLFVHQADVIDGVRLVPGDVVEFGFGVDHQGRPKATNVERVTAGRTAHDAWRPS